MRDNTIKKEILIRMQKVEKGTIFINSDFYDLGNKSTIKDALYRLANVGEIYRLIDGFYTIPKYSRIIQEYSYPTPTELADKIAKKYTWKISPYGETALNFLGSSTQVPAQYNYISNGPYRIYEYRGRTLQFKHTNNISNLSFSKELSLVIQALKAIGKNNLTKATIKKLAEYCKKNVKEDIVNDTKKITIWIHDALKKIDEQEINEKFYYKNKAFSP